MGFDIVYGDIGFLGAVLIVLGLSAGAIMLYLFVLAAKRARDQVVEDSNHDIEA